MPPELPYASSPVRRRSVPIERLPSDAAVATAAGRLPRLSTSLRPQGQDRRGAGHPLDHRLQPRHDQLRQIRHRFARCGGGPHRVRGAGLARATPSNTTTPPAVEVVIIRHARGRWSAQTRGMRDDGVRRRGRRRTAWLATGCGTGARRSRPPPRLSATGEGCRPTCDRRRRPSETRSGRECALAESRSFAADGW